MRPVSILFARHDSIYKTLPGCDVWDAARDARGYQGPNPVVAHPPCRAWGGLRHFAKPRDDEKDLARFAVAVVRKYGGILEHPRASTLWADQELPAPGGERDAYGGWTMIVRQSDWGHRAEKMTALYIVGVEPAEMPAWGINLAEPTHVVATGHKLRKGDPRYRKHLSHKAREATPPDFARWLVEVARRVDKVADSAILPPVSRVTALP